MIVATVKEQNGVIQVGEKLADPARTLPHMQSVRVLYGDKKQNGDKEEDPQSKALLNQWKSFAKSKEVEENIEFTLAVDLLRKELEQECERRKEEKEKKETTVEDVEKEGKYQEKFRIIYEKFIKDGPDSGKPQGSSPRNVKINLGLNIRVLLRRESEKQNHFTLKILIQAFDVVMGDIASNGLFEKFDIMRQIVPIIPELTQAVAQYLTVHAEDKNFKPRACCRCGQIDRKKVYDNIHNLHQRLLDPKALWEKDKILYLLNLTKTTHTQLVKEEQGGMTQVLTGFIGRITQIAVKPVDKKSKVVVKVAT